MIKREHYKTPPATKMPTTHEQVARMPHQQHVLAGANMALKPHVAAHTHVGKGGTSGGGKSAAPSGRTRGPVAGTAKGHAPSTRTMLKASKKK